MPSLTKLTAVAALALSSVSAAPWHPSAKLSTHKRHVGANNAEFQTYHPPVTYEVFDDGVHSLVSRVNQDEPAPVSVDDAAIEYLCQKLGLSKESLEIKSGYKSDTATHVYVSQKLNDVPVANGVANVVFSKDGKIMAVGSSLVKPAKVASVNPKLSEADAISAAETHLGAKHNSFSVKTEYVIQDTDHAALA
ncbi:hypothetical protein FRB90_007676, partial [Tulasnella sp. 427]